MSGRIFCFMTQNYTEVHNDLASDGNFIVALVTHRALLLVGVVKRDTNGGLRDAGLTVLVYQFLEVGSSHLHNIKQQTPDNLDKPGLKKSNLQNLLL